MVRLLGPNEKFIIETLLVAVVGGGGIGLAVGAGGGIGLVVGVGGGIGLAVGVGGGVGLVVGVAVGAAVGVGGGVGLAVGVAVGAAVGVVPVPVMVDEPPQAARSTRKPTASRHSQAFVMVGVDVFCISLPLLQCYCMNTTEDFLSPLKITLPGYRSSVKYHSLACRGPHSRKACNSLLTSIRLHDTFSP